MMRFSEIVSINGMSGLYKMEAQKVNGIIVTSLSEGWTKFVSSREHLFSLLESISIYTATDNMDLLDVLLEAFKQKEENPPIDAKSNDEELRAYFAKVLPAYDKEKVHVSDIRKFIKWFQIMEENGILQTELEEKSKEKQNDKPETEEEPAENKSAE